MPIYDYTCKTCGAEFDALRSIHDDDREVECPFCKETNAERQVSLTAKDHITGGAGGCGGGGRGSWRFG